MFFSPRIFANFSSNNLVLQPDRILLMDTFFQILIFHGETIAQWRAAGKLGISREGALDTVGVGVHWIP